VITRPGGPGRAPAGGRPPSEPRHDAAGSRSPSSPASAGGFLWDHQARRDGSSTSGRMPAQRTAARRRGFAVTILPGFRRGLLAGSPGPAGRVEHGPGSPGWKPGDSGCENHTAVHAGSLHGNSADAKLERHTPSTSRAGAMPDPARPGPDLGRWRPMLVQPVRLLRGDLLAIAALRLRRARLAMLEGAEIRIGKLPVVLGRSRLPGGRQADAGGHGRQPATRTDANRLWNTSARAGCEACRPWKPSAFPPAGQVEKGHGGFFPRAAQGQTHGGPHR